MARELVAIKVKIGLRPNGHADHPDFNKLACVTATGMDWSRYVDVYGLGWQYDKTSGHKEESVDSPFGQQNGVLVIPEVFADEAVAKFPTLISRLDETELETFWDEKAHAHEPDEQVDDNAIKGITTRESLGIALTVDQETLKAKALDPNDPTPGIRKNKKKKWADAKALMGVTIKEAVAVVVK